MRIGPYEIRETLGQGGMGVVYRAQDPSLGREVALKVLAATANPERFRREAEAMAKVSHPNVVRVHASGVDARGCPWIAMELVEGQALSDRLADERTLPVAEASRYAGELARALQAVHAQGLVHRDLKPANVLLRDQQALLTDFGLAREDEAERLTRTGQILGTPGYAPPELLVGPGAARAGPPADVYGLGATLYAMLTGAPPVGGTTLQEILVATASARPVPARELNPAVPASLSELCERCLEKDPDSRPTLSQFVDALEAGQVPPRSRRPLLLLGAGALLLALLLSAALVLSLFPRAELPPPSSAPSAAAAASPAPSAPPETSAEDLVRTFMAVERRLSTQDLPGAERIVKRLGAPTEGPAGQVLEARLVFARGPRRKRKEIADWIAPVASADLTGLGHYMAGRSYFSRRNYRESVASFSRAIALRPEPLYRLARVQAAILSKQGWETLEADLEVLDRDAPPWQRAQADGLRVRYLLRLGSYTAGRARVRKLIADHGATPEHLALLGRLLEGQRGNMTEARRALDLALAERKTDLSLWIVRIRIPLLAGEAKEARRVYERALKRLGKRGQRDPLLNLERVWLERLEGGDPKVLIPQLKATRGKGPQGYVLKARVWLQFGRVGLAKSSLQQAIRSGVPRYTQEAEGLLQELARTGR